MYISMQGNWSVQVKSKSAAFPQRFIISGAGTGNGTYDGVVSTPVVHVTGNSWTINIQNNPGTGFQASDTQIKFPKLAGGVYSFDIVSNDAGGDADFNDLILTCSATASATDYIVYGNVKGYSGNCLYNPCFPEWMVIESAAALKVALQNPILNNVISKLYPERIPSVIVNPNPPDPAPFVAMMINLRDMKQTPSRVANIYNSVPALEERKATKNAAEPAPQFKFQKSVTVDSTTFASPYSYDNIAIARLKDNFFWNCTTQAAPFTSLLFQQYDRSASELAGGPYTGSGTFSTLGGIVADMNGNYIFRFQQTLTDIINELTDDVAPGENPFVQYRPDLVVSIPGSSYVSAPYYNVPNMYRLDICLPSSELPTLSSSCFNGNLIGSLGNVFVGGTQNKTLSLGATHLNRFGYNNHLHSDGRISVHNTSAHFSVDCACWGGEIDLWGCMYNTQRKESDPIIRYFTIQYTNDGVNWHYVQESYLYPLFTKIALPGYNGELIGAIPTMLHVNGGPATSVPAYINIQAQAFHDGIPWEASHLNRYMQLNSGLYQGATPGTVYFKVEGFDGNGQPIADARDLIALYIDNNSLGFSLDNVWFDADGVNIIKSDCNLYRMTDAALNTPLNIKFKANDQWGFLDNYHLSLSNCGAAFPITESLPGISDGQNLCAGDTYSAFACTGYTGTAEVGKFGDLNAHEITYSPAPVPTAKWLAPAQYFTMLTVGLTAVKRVTNGYNTGYSSTYETSATVAVERIS